MSQSLWEPEVLPEQQVEPVLQPDQNITEPAQQSEPEVQSAAAPEVLALSVDDFSALEERVLRTVSLVKHERKARAEAEQRATKAEAQLREHTPVVDLLQTEVKQLRVERDHVRQRVERLLSQLDALEL